MGCRAVRATPFHLSDCHSTAIVKWQRGCSHRSSPSGDDHADLLTTCPFASSDRILTSLGVNIVAMTRANFSAESAAQYTGVSSFTRCVYEVKVGKVDLCVGDFWEMPERRRLAPFTSSVALDKSLPSPLILAALQQSTAKSGTRICAVACMQRSARVSPVQDVSRYPDRRHGGIQSRGSYGLV